MLQAERDREQLGIILRYCMCLDETHEHFGNDYERFLHSIPYQDGCALCPIQVGEAVGRLSDAFTDSHPQIDWRAIYGIRCHFVHGYDNFDPEIAWDALENHLPALRAFCEERFEE